MTDIENVISNLELNIRWICDNPAHQFPGYGNVETAMRDAMELLKEKPQIVRCKDCKHYMWPEGTEKGDCFIKMGYFPVSEDWYCADGEQKESVSGEIDTLNGRHEISCPEETQRDYTM